MLERTRFGNEILGPVGYTTCTEERELFIPSTINQLLARQSIDLTRHWFGQLFP